MSKRVRPRRAFAPEEGGHIWVEFARHTMRECRAAWCEGSDWDWERWKKARPRLRIIRVTVNEGWCRASRGKGDDNG